MWNTNDAHLGLNLILRNSNKIEGATYVCTIILQLFSQIVVTPSECSINPMNLKIFPNTNVLFKVDCFERFLNQSNVDELVINNMHMSVCI